MSEKSSRSAHANRSSCKTGPQPGTALISLSFGHVPAQATEYSTTLCCVEIQLHARHRLSCRPFTPFHTSFAIRVTGDTGKQHSINCACRPRLGARDVQQLRHCRRWWGQGKLFGKRTPCLSRVMSTIETSSADVVPD